jgi:hypothetical protein
MGMCDSYEPRPSLSCRSCGSPLSGWQGKSGPCWSVRWLQGCVAPAGLPADADEAECRLPDDFEIYTVCAACDTWIDARGSCEAGVWTKVTLIDPVEQADLPDDWLPIDGNAALCHLEELRREMPADHVLSTRRLFPVAQHREQEGDILVRTIDAKSELWLVHLTWRRETDPEWPNARPFRDLAEFVAAQRA